MHGSVRVSSYKTSPLLRVKPAPFVLLALLSSAAIASAQSVYYVAPGGSDTTGTGSVSSPWATLSKAILAIPDDGSTVIVRDGTYNGSVYAPRKFTQLAHFRAEHAYQAKLRNANDITLHIRYAKNVEFAGFDIARSNPSTTGPLNVKIAGAENVILRNNIIHESYNNDLLKMNEGARNILITGNVFRNQQGPAGQHIDVNGCTDVTIRENIFFNDAAAAGISASAIAQTHGFVVVKNSSMLPESRRTRIVGNLFMNFQGSAGSNYILLGEDGYALYETQEVDVANNILFGNFTSKMKAAFGAKGVRMADFRNNTMTGDMPSDAFALRINKEGTNLRSRDIQFTGNIWSDPTGTMTDFADGSTTESSDLTLNNNLYWNNGEPIPSDADVLNAFQDVRGLTADPKLPSTAGMLLPNWQGTKFPSGTTSIRQEFVRIVQTYGRPASGSPVIGRSDPSASPEFDILDSPRGPAPDLGAVQVGAAVPTVRVQLFSPRVMGGVTTGLNRVALPSSTGGTVFLTSSNPSLASVPATVTVPAGDDSVIFPITTVPTAADQQVTITATSGTATHRATLTVVPQGVVSVNASYAYPKAGSSDHFIMLEGPASIQPLSISLTSDRTDLVSFPSALTFPDNGTYAGFTIACKPETTSWTKVNITASSGRSTATSYVEFQPAQTGISTLSLSNSSPTGPATVTGTIRLSGPAQSNISVTLSASPSGVITMPSSLAIKTAFEGGTFSISVPKVTESKAITITAQLGTSTQTVVLNVGNGNPTASLSSLSLSVASVIGGRSIPATVTLSAPAPAGGAVVTLASNPIAALTVPGSVTVPAGATSASFNANALSVLSALTGTVNATYAGVTKAATLSIEPADDTESPSPSPSPSPSSPVITKVYMPTSTMGGGDFHFGVYFASPVPAGGVRLSIVPSRPELFSIPSVIIPAGAYKAELFISTAAVPSTVLTNLAITVGASSITRQISLTPASLMNLYLAQSTVKGGTSVAGNVIVATVIPAAGTLITVTSSNPAVVAVPATVSTTAGVQRPTFTFSTRPVTTSTPVTISVSSGGVTKSAVVTVVP